MRTATLLLILCPLWAQDATPLPDGASLKIFVHEANGEVDVRPSPKEKWVPATKGLELHPGAKVCTGAGSSAAISFGTNSIALLAECSICEVQTFEMRAEELVAVIHIDPGVAKVNVKQLAQFHTDFRVSTPRLTCSVKGSTALVIGNGDQQPDEGHNEEGDVSFNDTPTDPGTQTNSDGDSNLEIETKDNLADTTPEGSTDQETQDENLLATTNQTLENDPGSLTADSDPSPTGYEGTTDQEEGGDEPDGGQLMEFEEGTLNLAINGQDSVLHANDDDPDSEEEHGLEGANRQAYLDLGRGQGLAALWDQAFLPNIHEDFHDPTMDQLEQDDPDLFNDRHTQFHDDLPEAGFNALDTYLHAAALEASMGPVSERNGTLILASLFHTDFHIIHSAEIPQVYDPLHVEFHRDEINNGLDPLLEAIVDAKFDDALAMWAQLVHGTWTDGTGCEELPDEGDPCIALRQHFEMRLIETGRNYRTATGTLGIQSAEEETMAHVFLSASDVRQHSGFSDDLQNFQGRHDRTDFHHQGLEVLGLGAYARVFDAGDRHREFHEDPNGLEQQDSELFDDRHTLFHTSDSVFGLDGLIAFWSQVADQARNQNIDRGALGHALIAEIDVDFLKNNYSMSPGNSPGQFDYERQQFLSNVVDPMHAQVDGDMFPAFIHAWRDYQHNRWHTVTGIPQNVQEGQPGFAAHQHLHESLDDFHTRTHNATGIPDP